MWLQWQIGKLLPLTSNSVSWDLIIFVNSESCPVVQWVTPRTHLSVHGQSGCFRLRTTGPSSVDSFLLHRLIMMSETESYLWLFRLCRNGDTGWRGQSKCSWCGPTIRTCPTSGTQNGWTSDRHHGNSILVAPGSASFRNNKPDALSYQFSPISPAQNPVPFCLPRALWDLLPGGGGETLGCNIFNHITRINSQWNEIRKEQTGNELLCCPHRLRSCCPLSVRVFSGVMHLFGRVTPVGCEELYYGFISINKEEARQQNETDVCGLRARARLCDWSLSWSRSMLVIPTRLRPGPIPDEDMKKELKDEMKEAKESWSDLIYNRFLGRSSSSWSEFCSCWFAGEPNWTDPRPLCVRSRDGYLFLQT